MKFFFYSKILTNVITWSVLSVKTHPPGHGSVTGVLITSVTFFTPYNVTMHEYEQMHTHTQLWPLGCGPPALPFYPQSIHFTLSLCERPLLCTNRRAYWCWSMHRHSISTNHSSWTTTVQEKNCICKKCRLPSSSFQRVPKFTSPSLSLSPPSSLPLQLWWHSCRASWTFQAPRPSTHSRGAVRSTILTFLENVLVPDFRTSSEDWVDLSLSSRGENATHTLAMTTVFLPRQLQYLKNKKSGIKLLLLLDKMESKKV